MTERQEGRIRMNLNAFVANFGDVRIEPDAYRRGAFYVFYPAESDVWIQHCPNLDYLNGWLYGCVQGVIKICFLKRRFS